jgi:hypothetical protein
MELGVDPNDGSLYGLQRNADGPWLVQLVAPRGSWRVQSRPFTADEWFDNLRIDPRHAGVLYAEREQQHERSVFRSDDAGVTWTPLRSGLPTGSEVVDIALDPVDDRVIYAVVGVALFKSSLEVHHWWTLSGRAPICRPSARRRCSTAQSKR